MAKPYRHISKGNIYIYKNIKALQKPSELYIASETVNGETVNLYNFIQHISI